jgi:putative spermidine/putrescine transport system substrate-binding protein
MHPPQRTGFAVCVAIVATLALAACDRSSPGTTATEAQEGLRVASFGGSFQETLDRETVQPIARTLGLHARVEAYGGEYDRLDATIRNDTNTYDLVHVETRFLHQGARDQVLAPIDWTTVDRSAFVDGATHPHGVALLAWALVLAWNEDRLPAQVAHPSTWKDLFDTAKYPGPRALRNSPEGNLEMALLADGVPADEIYTGTPEGSMDVERALKKLDTIRDSISWWESGAELEQKLASSAAIAAAWNGRVTHLKHAGKLPLAWTFAGGINQFDWWVIPANSDRKADAMKFLAATAAGAGQAAIAREYGYGPVSQAVLASMPPDLQAETSSAEANAKLGIAFNGKWWAENTKVVTERWNRWRLGD